jgi:hypothetical protein
MQIRSFQIIQGNNCCNTVFLVNVEREFDTNDEIVE